MISVFQSFRNICIRHVFEVKTITLILRTPTIMHETWGIPAIHLNTERVCWCIVLHASKFGEARLGGVVTGERVLWHCTPKTTWSGDTRAAARGFYASVSTTNFATLNVVQLGVRVHKPTQVIISTDVPLLTKRSSHCRDFDQQERLAFT